LGGLRRGSPGTKDHLGKRILPRRRGPLALMEFQMKESARRTQGSILLSWGGGEGPKTMSLLNSKGKSRPVFFAGGENPPLKTQKFPKKRLKKGKDLLPQEVVILFSNSYKCSKRGASRNEVSIRNSNRTQGLKSEIEETPHNQNRSDWGKKRATSKAMNSPKRKAGRERRYGSRST